MYVKLEAHRRTPPLLRELIFKGEFIIAHVKTDEQHADFLTKPLNYTAFCYRWDFLMNIRCISGIRFYVTVFECELYLSYNDNAVFPGIEFRGFLMFPARATIYSVILLWLYMVTGSCRRQKLVPLQISPSARGCKFL